jgi:hypothetical protein
MKCSPTCENLTCDHFLTVLRYRRARVTALYKVIRMYERPRLSVPDRIVEAGYEGFRIRLISDMNPDVWYSRRKINPHEIMITIKNTTRYYIRLTDEPIELPLLTPKQMYALLMWFHRFEQWLLKRYSSLTLYEEVFQHLHPWEYWLIIQMTRGKEDVSGLRHAD